MLDPYFETLRQAALARRAAAPHPPSFAQMRAGLAAESQALGPGPAVVLAQDVTFTSEAGGRFARVFTPPSGRPRAVIVFIHGGGWALGSLDDFDALARKIAQDTDTQVILPDYRLAPEAAFPAGLNDVAAALVWAQSRAKAQDLPLVACGDSAGANLLLSAYADHKQELALKAIALCYPVAQTRMDTQSYLEFRNEQALSQATMAAFLEAYAAPSLHQDPRISLLQRNDLALDPDIFIQIAHYDPLREDANLLYHALLQAGCRVNRKTYPNLPHAFLRYFAQSQAAAVALNDLTAFLVKRV